jgi:hypothetical protein
MASDDFIKAEDVGSIAKSFNELTASSDENREKYANALLTIYTPVLSGLFFLTTKMTFQGSVQKTLFLTVVTTSGLIVLSGLIQKFLYFKTSDTMGKKFAKHVRETGKHVSGPLSGNRWEIKLLAYQVYIMTLLLLVNLVAIIIFAYAAVI